jgi:hypothetical protein
MSMIREDMAKPGADLGRVSQRYQIPARLLREELASPPPLPALPEINGGFGRPELQQFMISRKKVRDTWPELDCTIISTARLQYDAGTHEMCQGRDGDWIILYLIPRSVPAKRTHQYFLIADGYYYDR